MLKIGLIVLLSLNAAWLVQQLIGGLVRRRARGANGRAVSYAANRGEYLAAMTVNLALLAIVGGVILAIVRSR